MQFLKTITITLMLAAVLFQTFATVGFIVQFQANRSYYAEVLCINKNRPELACQGKCVLMQRLQHEFDQNQDAEKQTLKNLLEREFVLFCNNVKPLIVHYPLSDISANTKLNPQSKNFIAQSALSAIFHPPIHQA